MEKEIKIKAPEGYTIDVENSSFECIKFKPIEDDLTYYKIAFKLFNNGSYYGTFDSNINHITRNFSPSWNDCTSREQVKKLMAMNKLMNVAKYLNGDWKPDWDNCEQKWFIIIAKDRIVVDYAELSNAHFVYFKTEKLAKQAIKILGEDKIKLALSTDW